MPKRISTLMGVTRADLDKLGVFDATVDFDSKLHIDPALLGKTTVPEFSQANKKITDYFNDVLRLLKQSKNKGDALWRAAVAKLTFGEGLNTGLGYSEKGTGGSGIGPQLAGKALETIKEILDAGINDPTIFELVPIFEAKIGADRMSDMLSIILTDEIKAYTKRICDGLKKPMPKDHKGRAFYLLPKQLLNDLPIAEQWEDIHIAAAHNADARSALNKLLGISWKQFVREYKKEDIKSMLLKNPDLIREFLKLYKDRKGRNYDFVVDHLGIMLWDILGPQFAEGNFLDLAKYKLKSADDILKVLKAICNQFKQLIEHNGLVEHIYDSKGKRRPERFPQLLFYAIASSYCDANNLDLKREINNGTGALDFGLSQGLAKVNLEVKYSSNGSLVEGYEKQLKTYNRADRVKDNHSIYLILRVGATGDAKIKKIREIKAECERKGEPCPELMVIDAIIKPSASKRK